MCRSYRKMTIKGHCLYNLYIFVWIQHGYFTQRGFNLHKQTETKQVSWNWPKLTLAFEDVNIRSSLQHHCCDSCWTLLLTILRCSNALKSFANCNFAICAVSRLIHFRKKRFHYLYNVRFRYLQVCNQYVFTIQYDKSILKMYLEYIQTFNIYYIH